MLWRLGKPAEAAVACGKAVELSPDCAEAGDLLKELRRFDEAAASSQRAIVLKPGVTEVYRHLASVLRNIGKLDEATHVLKQFYTLEQCDASASAADYRLHPHGRYSHNKDYVKRCMNEHGLTIRSMESATLRKERDQPVPAIMVRARKKTTDVDLVT